MATNWNHAQIEERLSDYLERATTPEETAGIEAHLRDCAECKEMATQVGTLLSRMQSLEPVGEPPQLARKIIEATLGPRPQTTPWKRLTGKISWMWSPRFAMGAATVAATLLIVMNTVGSRPNHFKKWAWNPVDAARSVNRQAHLTYARSAKYVNDLRVVYEIQTKLQPEPSPQQAAPLPDSQPATRPKDGSPEEKSQEYPRHNRTQIRNGSLYAVAIPASAAMPPNEEFDAVDQRSAQ
ncbi:MAG: zf-HC2 domain-containing protein [Candidatus Acidiferrales bacterium]